MHLMLQQPAPKDYVIGTGITFSVKDFLKMAFAELDLNAMDYYVQDPRYFRPAEVNQLLANPTRVINELKWAPSTQLYELVRMMVGHDYDELKTKGEV